MGAVDVNAVLDSIVIAIRSATLFGRREFCRLRGRKIFTDFIIGHRVPPILIIRTNFL